jgi:hypothetical protein
MPTMSELYKSSTNQPREQIQRWPTARSKNWTESFLDSAREDKNIMAVVAVGSAVRPSVPTFDLDLVVICRERAKLTAKPPIEIDMRAYAADQVDGLIRGGNDLLGWAVKFGKLLFQREGLWDTILESWHDRLPLPSAEIASQRADDAFRRMKNVYELGDSDAAYEQALSYVTHLARAELLKRRVYPASRPELPGQLHAIGCLRIAGWLEKLIDHTPGNSEQIAELLESRRMRSDCT